jgi:Transmembrane amino acid transporter protein
LTAFLFRHLSQVSANVIAMYPSTSLFIAVGQLAIAILVIFSYPLQVQPCRNCLDKVFHLGSAADKIDDEAVDDAHGAGDMTPLKHTLLTSAVVAGGFIIAYFVDNLEIGVSSSLLRTHLPRLTVCSVVLCRGHGINDHFIHPPWTYVLEGRYP